MQIHYIARSQTCQPTLLVRVTLLFKVSVVCGCVEGGADWVRESWQTDELAGSRQRHLLTSVLRRSHVYQPATRRSSHELQRYLHHSTHTI